MADTSGYRNIFKTTFLFGFVQIFNIIVKIVQNKIVAFLLGPTGMGIIGLYQNNLNLITTGCGLGINQSAVKDISEAKGKNEDMHVSYVISLVRRLILYTGIFGLLVTVVLSYLLSNWSFGNSNYTIGFLLLSVSSLCTIIATGQTAILTGMRKLKALAKSSMIGSIVGLCTSAPLYWLLGENGIVPGLIVASLSSLIITRLFVDKIPYKHYKITIQDLDRDARQMIKMGISLMLVSLLGFLFAVLVSIMIRYYDSVTTVGIYTAGVTIISGYFGIVITAMTTDYYPRICAINNDNEALNIEVNNQAEVGLLIVFPLAVIFILFSKLFISFLYSNQFYQTINYTDYAVLGMIIIVCSNCMGMILLAKQKSRIFLCTVLFQRTVIIIVYYVLFIYKGILGLGIGYFILGILALLIGIFVNNRYFSIKFNKRIFSLLFLVLSTVFISIYIREMKYSIMQIILYGLVMSLSIFFTYFYMKKYMNIEFRGLIKKIKGK